MIVYDWVKHYLILNTNKIRTCILPALPSLLRAQFELYLFTWQQLYILISYLITAVILVHLIKNLNCLKRFCLVYFKLFKTTYLGYIHFVGEKYRRKLFQDLYLYSKSLWKTYYFIFWSKYIKVCSLFDFKPTILTLYYLLNSLLFEINKYCLC